MTEIRTCWAFNKEGQRCEHPAGHPGNHVITAEWGDDECFSPIRHQLPDISTPAAIHPAPPVLVSEPVVCVACKHQHKAGPCKCGCHEMIA